MRLHNPAEPWGPYDETRYVAILTPQPIFRYRFRVLGEACYVLVMHFLEDLGRHGQYVPCCPDSAACVGCKRFLRPRYMPFLACWWEENERHVVVQLTRDCLKANRDLQPMHGVRLRGRYLECWREGKTTFSPLHATLSEPQPNGEGWPIAADVLAVLGRRWQRNQAGLVLVDEAP
jgi:hypothetical protein